MNLVLILLAATLATCWSAPVLKPYAAKFDQPTFAAQAPGETARLWVLEKPGTIQTLDLASGEKGSVPLLDLKDQITIKMNEQGLLGLAFDPDFKKNRRFYLYFTDNQGNSRLSRFTQEDSPSATKASEDILLEFDQDFKNHNGGFLDVGPDGFLYLGTGDGGAGNDPNNRAQNLDSYLGKLLRFDIRTEKGYKVPIDNPFINHKGAKPEIYAYGLRNPWRCSFDGQNGLLWIGDVGQNHWEEINAIPLKQARGGNFGWRLREGHIATPRDQVGGDAPAKAIEPVYVYQHGTATNQGLSVTGGYVYRGKIKSLRGKYLFADYVKPHIWTLSADDGKFNFSDLTKSLESTGRPIRQIASFARDNSGELYLVDHGGYIYQLVEQ